MTMSTVTLRDIEAARERIKGVALRTPLISFPGPHGAGNPERFFLKCESMQPIGSFKLRGAYNKVSSLTAEELKRGVIAHSSGNHAQGVAFAARAMGTSAVIVIPEVAPKLKIAATKALGARVELCGPASSDRVKMADEIMQREDRVMVHPYNDPLIIAGQGTIGLEVLDDLAEVELVLVPVSGGGLISGVAAAIKQRKPECKVIGVEPELAADARESLKSGKQVTWDAKKVGQTIADGLRATPVGDIPFVHIRKFVDDIVTVTEEEIKRAIARLALEAKIIAEPSGAVTTAAYLFHRSELPAARTVVAVVSGGNIAPEMLRECLGLG